MTVLNPNFDAIGGFERGRYLVPACLKLIGDVYRRISSSRCRVRCRRILQSNRPTRL